MSKIKEWAVIWTYDSRNFKDFSELYNRKQAIAYANRIIADRVDYELMGCDSIHFIDINNDEDKWAYDNFDNNFVQLVKIPNVVRKFNNLKYIVVHFDDDIVSEMLPFSNKKLAIKKANDIVKDAHEDFVGDGEYIGDEDDYQLIDGKDSLWEAYDWEAHHWCVLVELDEIGTGE